MFSTDITIIVTLFLGIFVPFFIITFILVFALTKQPCSGTIIGKTIRDGHFTLFLKNEKGAQVNLITDEETYTETQWGDPYTKKETDNYSLSR